MSLSRRRLLAAAPAGLTRHAHQQPNIMIIVGDDHTWSDLGCCGSRQAATPNIDRIAHQGVRFTHAFTGTAMCSPMRQQMMTGIFPIRNGAYPNHSQIKPGIQTWPAYFKQLGYRAGLIGKRHFGPQTAYPYEYLAPDAEELNFAALEEFVRRNANQPYCVFVMSHQPHGPHTKGDPSRHPPSKLTLPQHWVDTPATRETLSKYFAEVEYLDGEVGRCLDIVEKSGAASNTIVMYCSEQGIGMPFAKWTCYDMGLRETVAVRWPGRIRPGTVTDAMVQSVDWLPTLLEAAGGKSPEGIDGRSALHVLTGQVRRHADEVFGAHTTRGIIAGSDCYPIRSIRTRARKLILNLNHPARFHCVVQNTPYWAEWMERSRLDETARRITARYETRPAVEFYDLARDPFEQHNLAGRPECQSEIERLTARLRSWMGQQGDRGNETEMLVPPNRRSE